MTNGNPAFCLFLYLTGIHFRGELQHVGDVSQVLTNQNSRNRWRHIARRTTKSSLLFEMELFAEIVKGFQAISIFTKCIIIDV